MVSDPLNNHAAMAPMGTSCQQVGIISTATSLLSKTADDFSLPAAYAAPSGPLDPASRGLSGQFQLDSSKSCNQSMCYLR